MGCTNHVTYLAVLLMQHRLIALCGRCSPLVSFGARGEKKMYGKTTFGTLRRTFIFDENGILEGVIEKVDTKNAAGQILEG